ncbi:MAG: thioredoxin family protein [Chitinophagales bacterium]
MRKALLFSGLVIMGGIIVSFAMLNSNKPEEVNPKEKISNQYTESDLSQSEFKWYTVEEAIAQNKVSGKKIFIDVYTTWCGPCKWLDANTFSNPVIRKQLNDYFIPTKFNAESSDTIYFKDKVFVNPKPNAAPRMSTHEFTVYIASTQQGIAYPTMVFLDENMDMIQPISGALSAEQLEPVLEYIGKDYFKTTPWETFTQSYKSNLNH